MYEAKDFSHLLGMEGFSDTLLNNHFTLYQGYVTNLNKLEAGLKGLTPGNPEYNELRRRLGWEFNGVRLHELYFGNMKKGGSTLDAASEFTKKLDAEFGSFDGWKENFLAAAGMRGIGWVVLYHDTVADRLFNVWIDDHGTSHLSGATPLLVMDMWEHAFMVDYGLKKPDYIAAFLNNVDWEAVAGRLK